MGEGTLIFYIHRFYLYFVRGQRPSLNFDIYFYFFLGGGEGGFQKNEYFGDMKIFVDWGMLKNGSLFTAMRALSNKCTVNDFSLQTSRL